MLYYKRLTKHKSFEIEAFKVSIRDSCAWFRFLIEQTRGCDHAGFQLTFELFGFILTLQIYDHRHWDYENKKWCEYED